MKQLVARLCRCLVLLSLIMATALPMLAPAEKAFAVEPDEILADPALEARAREISTHLRCLVCQNETIDDSNAELAKDLRVLVRERLTAGDTDQQVKDYIVARYGEFVLLQPPFVLRTWLLWLSPLLLLAIGVVGVLYAWKGQKQGISEAATVPDGTALSAPLSEEEKKALDAILAGKSKDQNS